MHDLDEVRVAGLLYLALTPGPGKPRDLFGHWQIPADLQNSDAVKKMWQVLDAEFVRRDYAVCDEAQARYIPCRRTPGMKMEGPSWTTPSMTAEAAAQAVAAAAICGALPTAQGPAQALGGDHAAAAAASNPSGGKAGGSGKGKQETPSTGQ